MHYPLITVLLCLLLQPAGAFNSNAAQGDVSGVEDQLARHIDFDIDIDTDADIFDLGGRYFQTVGDEESIPLGIITALTQDKQGFIWIGTQMGLVRYDGYRFRRFQFQSENPASLGGDFISVLWGAPDGKVWAGTRHNGVSVYDPKTEKFVRYAHNPQNKWSISDNYITAIIGDENGIVWVGTKHGLDRFNPMIKQFSHYYHDADNATSLLSDQVASLMLDKSNVLWVGTENGLCQLKPQSKVFEPVFSSPANSNENNGQTGGDSLFQQTISKLFLASDGKIWIGTNGNGAAWIDEQGELHRIDENFSHIVVNDIVQPTDDEIWFATYGGGVNLVDAKSGRVKKQIKHDISVASSLNHDSLGAMLLDHSGLLWLGTWGNGLNLYNPGNAAFSVFRHSPSKPYSLSYPDVITLMELNNHDIWVGTRGNGIDVIRPGIGLIKGYRSDPEDEHQFKDGSISALLQTQDGTIWVGTRQTGFYRYLPETDNFRPYTKEHGVSSNEIKRLLEGADGALWIGTGVGLDRLDPVSGEISYFTVQDSPFNTLHSRVNALAMLDDGTLFAGASNGLYRLTPGDKHLTITTHDPSIKHSISHNTVLGLFVDEAQNLFVATEQGLDKLMHWDGEQSIFSSINAQVGYPEQALWANMQKDQQGRIWDGKSIIDLEKLTRRELTKADGVDFGVNWYAGYAKTHLKTLLYAGSRGLLMVRPEQFKEWQYQPPVVITQLIINGKQQPYGNLKHLPLSAGVKSFSLEFAALDYTDPTRNLYAYQLQGYDRELNLINAENRNASYTNLPPGDYNLVIKGTNRLGLWSEQQINLAITIAPQWFQTLWFYLLVIVASISLLYLIYFIRVSQLHRHKEQLRIQVDERTQELQQSNMNISTLSDIGNEISATLELDKILNTVYYHVNRMMDANVFCIGFYDQESDNIIFKLTMERGVQLPEFSVSMNEKERLAVWCVENAKPVVINDFAKDKQKYIEHASYVAPKSGEETASVIYWPLIVGGKTIGTISVQSFSKNAYTSNHQKIIRTLASTTATALDNANAYFKAQQAAEIKSAFLANMSHEIRTPMHGILGMTKLVSKTKLTLEQKEYIKNIGISANTLLTVINDVLDFSKIEAGKMPLEEKPFGLTRLLTNMSIVVDTLAEDKGLVFDYHISPGTPGDFIGDAPRINQILLNLCSNAVKFTNKGTITVEVSSMEIAGGIYTLEFAVTDQGIGIPPEAMSRLFHSFSQADTSTTRKYGGTGLGLAISRLLARKMQGDITVTSESGVGSCFTLSLELPAYVGQANAKLKKLELKNACHILVLDADPDSSEKIKTQLQSLDATVEIVTNDNQLRAIAVDNAESYDVAFLSWDAIEANNAETIAQLKSSLGLEPQNIIVYTHEKIRHLIKKVSSFEIENILQKPLSIIELKGFINKYSRRFTHFDNQQVKPLNGLLILVAEDNPINQLIAKKLLTNNGAQVEVAENGRLAIEKIQKKSFDIVLMDIQMPEMDGTEATRIIRNIEAYKDLPIIAMTANVLQKDVENYKNFGINDHVSKPIDTDDLIFKIKKYVNFNRHAVNT